MEKINTITLILLLFSISALVCVIKYIIKEKRSQRTTYGQILIEMIKSLKFKKTTLGNDYPEYPGTLEQTDTNEFIDYLETGILEKFDDKSKEHSYDN